MTQTLLPLEFASKNLCVTIDSTPDPALDCVRVGIPGTPGNQNNAEAAHNLAVCLGTSQGTGIVVGHGNVGAFCTGGGPIPKRRDQRVATWDMGHMAQYFS